MNRATKYTSFIREQAISLGFSEIGISKAELLEQEAIHLKDWLDKGYHGEMNYMANHFEKRVDPRELVPGAKSVISFLFNYYTEKRQPEKTTPKISIYAYGRDYHKVIRKKLKLLYRTIRNNLGEHIEGRYFVDSGPLLERDWAKRSGLGWIGKNTLLINPKMGSYFFLAEMILNVELEYDEPISDFCGTCNKCVDACPTNAIKDGGYEMDGSKCISYLTIELKDEIPTSFKGSMEDYIFGCDICQDVCPWNRFSSPHREPAFDPKKSLMEMTDKDWVNLEEDRFDELFEGSAVKRTKYKGLKRNIDFLDLP